MDFPQAEQQRLQLSGQLSRGQITPEAYTAAINAIRVTDSAGRWWQPSPQGQGWLWWDGMAWLPGTPPQSSGVGPVYGEAGPRAKDFNEFKGSLMTFDEFKKVSKETPLAKRPRKWWDFLSILGGVVGAILWFLYGGIRSGREGFDLLTPLLMIGIPIVLVWFRADFDEMLLPLQPHRKKVSRILLIGLGMATPFLTAWILYNIIHISQYPLMQANLVVGTLTAYAITRDPQIVPKNLAKAGNITGVIIIVTAIMMSSALIAPVIADDCARDPLNAQDCLRTSGYAEALAGLVATILSILINGPIIAQTFLQGGAGAAAGVQPPTPPVQPVTPPTEPPAPPATTTPTEPSTTTPTTPTEPSTTTPTTPTEPSTTTPTTPTEPSTTTPTTPTEPSTTTPTTPTEPSTTTPTTPTEPSTTTPTTPTEPSTTTPTTPTEPSTTTPTTPTGPSTTTPTTPTGPSATTPTTPATSGGSPQDLAAAGAVPAAATSAAAASTSAVPPGIDPNTGRRILTPEQQARRDFLRSEIEKNSREAAEWSTYSDRLGYVETGLSVVEKTADIAIDIGSTLSPGAGGRIKNIYGATKTIAKNVSESYAGGTDLMDGLKKGVVEAATDKALDVFAGKVTDRFNGKVPGFGKYESPAGDMGNLSVGQIRDRLTAAAPDTGDVLQNLRNTAAQRLDTREALGNAAKNAVQGQVQGATLWDPFKKFFGVTKE